MASCMHLGDVLVLSLVVIACSSALVLPVSTHHGDARLVEKQLGYLPPNFREVSAWTLDGSSPVAIKTYPLQKEGTQRNKSKGTSFSCLGSPFPTLYWLTCPHISRAVSDLERRGFVSQLQDRLRSDPRQAAQLLACHEHYAQERWSFLSQDDKYMLETEADSSCSIHRMMDMLKSSGVAGTNHRTASRLLDHIPNDTMFVASIKCLHAHYAHYRSHLQLKEQTDELVVHDQRLNINPVGRWVHELLLNEYSSINL